MSQDVTVLFDRDIYFKTLPAVTYPHLPKVAFWKQKATQKADVCLNTYRSFYVGCFCLFFFTHECVLCWIPLKYIYSQYFYSFFQPLLLLLHISLVWVPAPLDFVRKLRSFSYVHAIVFLSSKSCPSSLVLFARRLTFFL